MSGRCVEYVGVCMQAALKGEEWTPCLAKKEEPGGAEMSGAPTIPPPPTEPPPRHPDTSGITNGGYAADNRLWIEMVDALEECNRLRLQVSDMGWS